LVQLLLFRPDWINKQFALKPSYLLYHVRIKK
jgi:hypothetical protein